MRFPYREETDAGNFCGAPILAQCDRCLHYEIDEDDRFPQCEECVETLCPEHWAEGDEKPTADTCASCVEKLRDRAVEAYIRHEVNQ